jgi:hypothetical protein
MRLYLPIPLFIRLQKVGGVERSKGFYNDTFIAALEEYLPRFEKAREAVPEGTTWLDQLVNDTTKKKRARAT